MTEDTVIPNTNSLGRMTLKDIPFR